MIDLETIGTEEIKELVGFILAAALVTVGGNAVKPTHTKSQMNPPAAMSAPAPAPSSAPPVASCIGWYGDIPVAEPCRSHSRP